MHDAILLTEEVAHEGIWAKVKRTALDLFDSVHQCGPTALV